jgi:hypothetical protein
VSAKKVRRWNQLMPEVGGQPMPPRAKRDEVWRQKVWIEIIKRGAPIEAQRAAADLVTRAAAEAIALVGRNHAAVLLDHASETAAEPGRGGRPRGSGAYKLHQLEALMQAVLALDDGSPEGRRKAIAAVVQSKPVHHRAALRVWLKRHLPQQHSSRADKTRT